MQEKLKESLLIGGLSSPSAGSTRRRLLAPRAGEWRRPRTERVGEGGGQLVLDDQPAGREAIAKTQPTASEI